MRAKFYIELSEANWDHNLDCLEGREHKMLLANSKPNSYRNNGFDLISFEVDLPDRYFKPREADVVLNKISKGKLERYNK